MRISAKKSLEVLKDAGLIKSYKGVREYDDLRDVYEKAFKIESDHIKFINNEIYGRDARMYVYANTPQDAKKCIAVLKNAGCKIDSNWGNENKFEYKVSYFKGHRWWE